MTPGGELEIHHATAADADAIRVLHRALCAELYPGGANAWIDSAEGSSYLARRLAGEGLALVATAGASMAGYLLAGVRSSAEGQEAAGLESMYVVPDFRRRTIGLALAKQFLRWFADSGLHHASVAVQPENIAAHRLYQKAGFTDHALIENGRTLILRIGRAEQTE